MFLILINTKNQVLEPFSVCIGKETLNNCFARDSRQKRRKS